MSSSTGNNNTPITPIAIVRGRQRSASSASSIPALSNSPTSPIPGSIPTPTSTFSYRFGHHRSASEDSASGAPGTSPTSPLAYFLGAATSPPARATSGPGFPFTAAKSSAIDEDEESPPGGSTIGLFGIGAHTRRGSWAQNGAFAPVSGTPNDRGAGVLRRLSLSGAFQRPAINGPSGIPTAPPSSAVNTSPSHAVPTLAEPKLRKGRAATLGVSDPTKKRGISPMGERLLKGHFDGFI